MQKRLIKIQKSVEKYRKDQ